MIEREPEPPGSRPGRAHLDHLGLGSGRNLDLKGDGVRPAAQRGARPVRLRPELEAHSLLVPHRPPRTGEHAHRSDLSVRQTFARLDVQGQRGEARDGRDDRPARPRLARRVHGRGRPGRHHGGCAHGRLRLVVIGIDHGRDRHGLRRSRCEARRGGRSRERSRALGEGRRELGRVGRPVDGHLREALAHEVLDRRGDGHAGRALAHRGHRARQVRPQELHGVVGLKGPTAAEHAVEDHPEGVEVGRGRDGLALNLLGGHVFRRPGHLAQGRRAARGALHEGEEAEVFDRHAHGLRPARRERAEHHVGGPQVAVRDAEPVRGGEGFGDLSPAREALGDRHALHASQPRVQGLAVGHLGDHAEEVVLARAREAALQHPLGVRVVEASEGLGVAPGFHPGRAAGADALRGRHALHEHGSARVGLRKIQDASDEAALHPRDRARFATHARGAGRAPVVLAPTGLEHLQRDAPLCRDVHRLEDDAHPALAQQADEPVLPEYDVPKLRPPPHAGRLSAAATPPSHHASAK